MGEALLPMDRLSVHVQDQPGALFCDSKNIGGDGMTSPLRSGCSKESLLPRPHATNLRLPIPPVAPTESGVTQYIS